MMQRESRKGELMTVGTCVSLCVQHDKRPYKYVSVEGPVTSVAPYDVETDLLAMATRYVGESGGLEFIKNMREKAAKGNGIKVTIKPERWLSLDYELA
jgi:hypothetical protein